MKRNRIIKYLCFYTIVIWGILSTLYLTGEPVDENMPISAFCLCKIAGIGSLELCLIVGRGLNRAGMFPKFKDDEDCKL